MKSQFKNFFVPEGADYYDVCENDLLYLNEVFGGLIKRAYWLDDGPGGCCVLVFENGATVCVQTSEWGPWFNHINLEKQCYIKDE